MIKGVRGENDLICNGANEYDKCSTVHFQAEYSSCISQSVGVLHYLANNSTTKMSFGYLYVKTPPWNMDVPIAKKHTNKYIQIKVILFVYQDPTKWKNTCSNSIAWARNWLLNGLNIRN